MEHGLSKNEIIGALAKSPHGKLEMYIPVCLRAANEEPEFFAHLVAWNRLKGQVRDAQVALPIIAMGRSSLPPEFLTNALAHFCLLPPRDMLRAYRFAMTRRKAGQLISMRLVTRTVHQFLAALEAKQGRWERVAIQHRRSLHELYALTHAKRSRLTPMLFEGERPAGSIFEVVASLRTLNAKAAAAEIIGRKIPFLVALSALGKRAHETDLVLALIERMTPTELVSNTKMLERLGARKEPALRAAFEAGLQKVAKSKRTTLKTSVAADALEDDDPGLANKLRAVQEKQLQALGCVEGNWLVLADCSGSMSHAIEAGRFIAATLARMVKGQIRIVFFNVSPRGLDVTGQTLEAITALTRHVQAGGGTSIGCGVRWAIDAKFEPDGIAVVSDGGENNTPLFGPEYRQLCKTMEREPTVYFYKLRGNDPDRFSPAMAAGGMDMQTFDLTSGTLDYYSLPALVETMRVSRYSLVDEIMASPLLTLESVLA